MAKNSIRGNGPRRAVNTKITDDIRSRLETAAANSNRTLSAEIECRLVASLALDEAADFSDAMSKDNATTHLVIVLKAVLGTVFRYTEKSWQHDQPSRDAVACAAGLVLKMMFDNYPIDLPPAGSDERYALERQRLVSRASGRTIALGVMAPRMKDKSFQTFYDELSARSGWTGLGSDGDSSQLLRNFEELSDPKD